MFHAASTRCRSLLLSGAPLRNALGGIENHIPVAGRHVSDDLPQLEQPCIRLRERSIDVSRQLFAPSCARLPDVFKKWILHERRVASAARACKSQDNETP